MRVIDALFGRLKRKRRDDPVFGSMLYMGDRLKYWEGKAVFKPTNANIEVFVDGTLENGMEQQRDFYQQVMREWPILRENIGRVILQRWHERTPKLSDDSLWNLFTVSSISIPRASMEGAQWEISFVTSSDPNHLWTMRMNGRQPQQLSVDV